MLLCGLCYAAGCKINPYFQDAGPLVETNSGYIVGKYKQVFDTNVAAFLGIPYAMPPVDEKRFRKPDPVKPWKGKIFADKMSPPCMQYNSLNYSWSNNIMPSEDCLYLNIWSPTRCCCDSLNKLPVLVWIHGGGFFTGSSNVDIYDGSTLAAFGEAVVVSMNYRLGIFGFLSDGTELAPGNMGMYDQIQALKWIKENIHFFGGDHNDITLFGHSAGAISVGLHMVSPLSKDLFHRAIMQSGSAYHPSFIDTPRTSSDKKNIFSMLVNCSGESTPSEVTHCLKRKDSLELAIAENTLISDFPISFVPVTESELLPKHPIDAFDSGDIAPVDVLTGVMSDEASIFLNYMVPSIFPLNQEPSLTLEFGKNIMKNLFKSIPETIGEALSEFYLKNITENDSSAIIKAIINSFGDYAFNCPVMFHAEKTKNAYMYWITHRSLKNTNAVWVGSTHFDEVPFVFGKPIIDAKHFTPEDGRFSGDLLQKWVTFARTGYPLNEDSSYTWTKFSSETPIVHELNPRNNNYFTYPRKEACEFMRPFFKAN